MTLQESSNRLNLPKYLQHEDEEQWISGEELCTDGSSDEDTTLKKGIQKISDKICSITVPYEATISYNVSSSGKSNEDILESPQSISSDTLEWRPKREYEAIDYSDIHTIKMEQLDFQDEYKKAIEELQTNKNFMEEFTETYSENDYKDSDITLNESELKEIENYKLHNKKLNNFYQELQNCKKECFNQKEATDLNIDQSFHTDVSLNSYINNINLINYEETLALNETNISEESNDINQSATNNYCTTFTNSNFSSKNFHLRKKYKTVNKLKDKTNLKIVRSKKFYLKKMEVPSVLNSEELARLQILLNNSSEEKEICEVPIEPIIEKHIFKCTEEELENLEEINRKLKILKTDCDNPGNKHAKRDLKIDEDTNLNWKECIDFKNKKINRINCSLQLLQQTKLQETLIDKTKSEQSINEI